MKECVGLIVTVVGVYHLCREYLYIYIHTVSGSSPFTLKSRCLKDILPVNR